MPQTRIGIARESRRPMRIIASFYSVGNACWLIARRNRIEPHKQTIGTAFSLIELLVVISIVAVLISMLLPALRSMRIAAHQVVATSNTRQILLGLQAYAADYNQRLPYSRGPWTPNPSGGGNYVYWPAALYHGGYTTDINVFWGPDRDTSSVDRAAMLTDRFHPHWRYSGFGVNWLGGMMIEPGSDPDGWAGRMLPMQLDEPATPPPSNHILVAEGDIADDEFDGSYNFEIPRPSANGFRFFTRNGALTRGFADGSATSSDSASIGWTATGPYSGIWNYSFHTAPWYGYLTPGYWNDVTDTTVAPTYQIIP